MQDVFDFFIRLFDTSDWPPRWHCGKWTDFHGWLYIISDLLVASAYFAIPLIIIRYITRKHDARFIRLYFLFAGFILACGSTHLFDAITFWKPLYRVNALLRLITGVLSWTTVLYLIKLLPLAFSLRTSRELEVEVEQRKRAEAKVREVNNTLERKVQERTRELELKNQELERKNHELEQFAYVASHDLQEPLRTLKSFVELLSQQYKGQLDENADRYIQYISHSSDRMRNLIHDLLEYSRIGKEKIMEPVDCNEVLNEVLADLESTIRENQAVINTVQLPVVTASKTTLKQLFQNLVSNAIKFRKPNEKPVVNLHVEKEEGRWKFGVTDNGIGIEPAYQEKIFEIFKRLHKQSEYEGSGIGLAHCKKIVELYGGKIWVESVPGEGSTFFFTIAETN